MNALLSDPDLRVSGCRRRRPGCNTCRMERPLDYVLRTVEERGVRFVRLWFTDVLGKLKSFAITPAELEGALEEGMTFDGSAIEGYTRVQEADMLARPDPGTFEIVPWRGDDAPVARMFCDVHRPDGEPFEGDPRYVLKRNLAHAFGSGMHTHISLFEGDVNAFHDPGDEYGLSKVGKCFIAGLLRHAPEITAVTNQWVNSYKRLAINSDAPIIGYEAPVYVCW